MIPAVHDIKIKRGDTYSLFGRIRDKVWDGVTQTYIAGPYKNITGWTGLCQLRANEDAVDISAVGTITLGNQTTVPGSFFMTMSKTVTAALTGASGVYDIQFTTPAGEDYTYVGGKWTLLKDVSRA